MFTRNLNTLLCVLITTVATAQEFPQFGIPTQGDLAIKSCSFDPDAEAIILSHEAVSYYNDEYNLLTSHHYRIKILKEKGKHYGEITIPYYSDGDFEYIDQLEAVVNNKEADGSLTTIPVERKLFYRAPYNKNITLVKFTFPALKVGSILDYKYVSTMKHYGGLRDWEFQEEIPVAHSRYSLSIVPNAEFAYAVNKSPQYNCDISKDPNNGRIVFEMNNLPGLGNEPYMDARKDYLQKVTFQLATYQQNGSSARKYMTNWDEVIRETYGEVAFGNQLNKSIPGTDDFIKLSKAEPDLYKRMSLVYNLVRSSKVWNGEQSKRSVSGVKDAWNRKSGNSGDMNLALINLLQNAGLEVYPLLVSQRSNGLINKDLPFVDQFNTLMAMVRIADKTYYLDATEKYCPPNIIPSSVLNTQALLMKRRGGGIIEIRDESLSFRQNTNITMKLQDDNSFTGKVIVLGYDYARVEMLKGIKENRQEYIQHYYSANNPGIAIDSFELKNEDIDSLGLQASFVYTIPVTRSGEYTFIPLNLFNEFQVNPFVSEKRLSNLNFGYKSAATYTYYISLPDGYKVDALPKSMLLKTPDKSISISREVFADELQHQLVCKIRVENTVSWFPVDEYLSIRQFFKLMNEMLSEQVVLKK